MSPQPETFDSPAPALGAALAFELQDELLSACHDLERLLGLLGGTCRNLGEAFHEALALIAGRSDDGADAAARLTQLEALLARALPTLQFDDMASQLVTHTRRRLRHTADRLAIVAMGEDDDAVVEPAMLRPNPVTQDEMDAGSVELF